MEIGDRVKELREKAGLTQEELADRMGVQRNTVWRWENKKATLRTENIQRLSSVLNVDATELVSSPEVKSISQESLKPGATGGIFSSLAYWGDVADNARLVATSGQNLGLIYSLLADAANTVKAAMGGTGQVAAV